MLDNIGLTFPTRSQQVQKGSQILTYNDIYLSGRYRCTLTFTLNTQVHSEGCSMARFDVSIYQQTYLPYLAGLVHSVHMQVDLRSGEKVTYTETMIPSQRFIIISLTDELEANRCQLSLDINPFMPFIEDRLADVGLPLQIKE